MSEIEELRAAVARLRIFADGVSALSNLVVRKDGPHRVKIKGEWCYGPVADAYIELIEELASGARAALSTPDRMKEDGCGK